MAPPRSPGLDREQTMAVLAELYEALLRIRQLEDDLRGLADGGLPRE